jgi:hypothetical protein
MGSFLLLVSTQETVQNSSLLCFLSSGKDKCTGNGGPGMRGASTTTDRLGLGLLGIGGEILGSSGALLVRDHDNQPFIGLGQQWVWDKMAC